MSEIKGNKNVGFFFVIISSSMVACTIASVVVASLVMPFNIGIFRVSGGFLLFPLFYILSDVISEIYGYDKSRKVSWLVACVGTFSSLFFLFMYTILGAENASALEKLAKASWLLSVVGTISTQLGNWVNDIIFQIIKNKTKGKYFLLYSLSSTACGQIVDNGIFVFCGLMIVHGMSLRNSLITVGSQVLFKVVVGFGMTPILYLSRMLGNKFDPDCYIPTKKFGLFGGGKGNINT
jgi:uncharacterized integral membrane protein (TIGR00697 family)